MLTGLGAILISFITSRITFSVIKFLATKALLFFLFMVVLPIALFKAFSFITQWVLSYTSQAISATGTSSFVIQLTGIAAYLGDHLQLPLCFSILLSAMATRFALRAIRVIK